MDELIERACQEAFITGRRVVLECDGIPEVFQYIKRTRPLAKLFGSFVQLAPGYELWLIPGQGMQTSRIVFNVRGLS